MPEQLLIDLDNPAGQQRRQTKRGLERQQVLACRIPEPVTGSAKSRPSTRACKAVLLQLDEHVRGGEAWRISQAKLAAKCGLSTRCVIRALAWLVEIGLVSISRTGRSHIYCLNRAVIAELAEAQRQNFPPERAALASDQIRRTVTSDRTERHIRCDGASHQIGRSVTSDLIKDPLKDILSSSSSAPAPAEEEEGSSWCEVRKQLKQCEMHSISAAITGGQLRGLAPGDVLQLIAEFHERPDQNAGGLFFAIVEGTWPSSREREEARERQTAAVKRTAATSTLRAEQSHEVAEAQQRRRVLELRWGPVLDRLRPDELEALALRVYPGEFGRKYFYDRRGSPEGLADMRGDLLQQLHEEHGAPSLTTLIRTANT